MPVADPRDALTVSVDVAMVLGCGVIGLGRLRLTPLGTVSCHAAVSETGELNPACESTAMTELPDDPCVIVMELGPATTVKSRATAWLTVMVIVLL